MFWSGPNFFVLDQKLIYVYNKSKPFCGGSKDDFHFINSVFDQIHKIFPVALNEINSFDILQKNLHLPKIFWDLYKDKALSAERRQFIWKGLAPSNCMWVGGSRKGIALWSKDLCNLFKISWQISKKRHTATVNKNSGNCYTVKNCISDNFYSIL